MSVTLLQRTDGPMARRLRPRTQLTGATAALVNRLSRPREPFKATVEGLSVRVAPADVRLEAVPELPDLIEIGFVFDEGDRLSLALPAAILERLARAVQDDLASLPPPPTGAILVELALAPLLDAAERITGHRVRIESVGSPLPRSGAMTLMLDAAIEGEDVRVQIDLGRPQATEWPPSLDTIVALVEKLPPRSASVSELPVPLAFVAGRTALTLRQLKSLQVGDAVMPDLWLPARGEILIALDEGHTATATTDRHKSTLKTPFRPVATDVATASGGAGMVQDTTAEKVAPGNDADEAGLDAVRVTLAFELGRRTLGIGELKSVGAGHVFDLGLDPAQPVDLVANGARIGRGEIVEIGERIGIRVVRLFGQD